MLTVRNEPIRHDPCTLNVQFHDCLDINKIPTVSVRNEPIRHDPCTLNVQFHDCSDINKIPTVVSDKTERYMAW